MDNNYDYVSPGSPEGIIRGLDTEVFSINALNRAYDLAEKKEEKEERDVPLYCSITVACNICSTLSDTQYKGEGK